MTERDLCPDAGTWKTFLDGDVLDDAAAELAGHLENCEACQQTLERLAAGKETWEGTAKQLADADAANAKAGIESSGHLQSVLDDLKLGIDVGPSATASSRDVLRFLEPSDEPGSIGRLDSYEILEVVGAGGMGVVLRGWDPTLRRVVAIKVLAAHLANSAAAERRFVREAQAAAAVSHDHVVAIHAVGAGHEPPYLVMQFVEGKTLQQRLDRTGPLNVNEILRIGQQTALGLAAAHRQGIVHRDIKPANILLENGVERVRITDFGLARAIDDASMTQSGVVAGTPLFMAPEQAQGQPVDHRSDLFSLGSVLYAMATGRPPFRSSTMKGVIRRVCDDQPRPIREINPDIPDWLCGIIDHLLAKNPAERFQSADEVAELLAGCLAHVQRPLSVRLPAMATAFAPQSTRVDEPEPTIAFQSPPQGVAEPATAAQLAADDVDATARALMKWPATLLFIVGLVDLLTVTVTLLYLMARFNATGSFHQVVTPKLWMFVPCGLCMIGAIRMGSLRSRVWSYVAIVAGLLSWPGIILGLPVGLWSLHRLGHPEVVAAFKRRPCSDWRESEIQAVPLTFGQELARVLIIALMWLMAIAIPLVSYVLAQDSGAFPNIGVLEKTMLSVAALAVIFGLASTLKHLERRRKAASGESEIRSTIARQIRRIPEVLICTLLTILTMQAIYADLSATNYDGIMEAAVVPLFCVTLVTLGVVVFINRRRIRELKATGQEDSELTSAYRTAIVVPTGLLVPTIVLLAVWSHRQATVGYVTFDVNDPMAKVSFRNSVTGKTYGWVAMWKRCRLPAGTYEWSVSDGPMDPIVMETGTLEVKPRIGQLLSVRVSENTFLDRLNGTWELISGNVMRGNSEGPAPTWAQPPALLSISMSDTPGRRVAVFISKEARSSGNYDGVTAYDCEFRAGTNPKRVSLLQPDAGVASDDWPCVATGYWRVGTDRLYLMLQPSDQPSMADEFSVPTGALVHYQFKRVVEKSTEAGQGLAAEAASRGDRESEALAEIQGLYGFETKVVKVERGVDDGQTFVEISAGTDDGLKRQDSLRVVRGNGARNQRFVGVIQLRVVEADRAVGIVKQETEGETISVGDSAQFSSRVAN